MRSRYWSCSKFADFIRGTNKPHSGTCEEWDGWRKVAGANKIRFWLAEDGLDYLQDFVCWPVDKIYNLKYYINNRWVTKSHALTAHPSDVKPGTWCDVGNRMLFCLFNELVNFVEIEKAWMHVAFDDEARKKYSTPFWATGWFRWRTWRSPEAGIAHLNWETELTNVDWVPEDHPEYGKPTHQAIAAREILELYNWWKTVRPARPDPYDESGWSKLCRQREEKGESLLSFSKDEEASAATTKALDKCRELEEAYEAEDEEMLIRLIRVRNSLWT